MRWTDDTVTEAFDAIYPGLCRYLEGVLGRNGAAPEVAQEALLRLYTAGPDRVTAGEERFWVYRVATNIALNEVRRVAVRRRLAGAATLLFGHRSIDPHEEAERRERDRALADALERLPARRRAALLLRERDGMSYDEIACVLGVSLSLVRTDIFRARASLRQDLGGGADAGRRSAAGGEHR
jgi:RNA polymerase sigma-70 factor (ECF subfamily)